MSHIWDGKKIFLAPRAFKIEEENARRWFVSVLGEVKRREEKR